MKTQLLPVLVLAALLFAGAHARADEPGQADLDKALELKLTSESLRDLNEVADLLDGAIEKGLDAENTDLAEQLLVATLTERATALSSVLLGQPLADPRQDPRWVQVRQVALADLERVVDLDPSQAQAYLLIGRLQTLPLGVPSAARRALTKAAESEDLGDEDRAQAYALRGATQTDPAKRGGDFSKAIELAPDKAEYLLLRAKHYFAVQEFDPCLADIDAAVKVDPENFAVHELRALALLAQEKPDEALKSFNRATELEPDAISPYQYRGEVYSRLGDLKEAIKQLDKALELDPDNVASLLIRAELRALDDQLDEALADVDTVIAKQPALLRAHLMRSRLLGQMGRTDEATAALEKLAEAAGDRPEVRLQLAATYAEKSRYKAAIEQLDKVLEADPALQIARRLRGDMYLSIGKHAEALADFEESLKREPDDSGVLNNFAWTLATSPIDELRDGKRAVELATRAAELTKFNAPHILSTLAAAYAETGDFDKAVEWSQKAIDLSKLADGETPEDSTSSPEDPAEGDELPTEGADQAEAKPPAVDVAEAGEGLTDALLKEIDFYKAKKPFRELKNEEASAADEAQPDAVGAATPQAGTTPSEEQGAEDQGAAPARTIDF